MSYPKKRINEELKKLAKLYDLTTYADIVLGTDIDGIKFISAIIFPKAPYITHILNEHIYIF